MQLRLANNASRIQSVEGVPAVAVVACAIYIERTLEKWLTETSEDQSIYYVWHSTPVKSLHLSSFCHS
jgi:hypothetical protein